MYISVDKSDLIFAGLAVSHTHVNLFKIEPSTRVSPEFDD